MAARISRKRTVACLRLNGQKRSAFQQGSSKWRQWKTRPFELVVHSSHLFGKYNHERGACRTCEELAGHLNCSDIENVVLGTPRASEELLVEIYRTRSSLCKGGAHQHAITARGAPRAFELVGRNMYTALTKVT
eukprot:1789246-Pleurochrysis_carterae.AAC.1